MSNVPKNKNKRKNKRKSNFLMKCTPTIEEEKVPNNIPNAVKSRCDNNYGIDLKGI